MKNLKTTTFHMRITEAEAKMLERGSKKFFGDKTSFVLYACNSLLRFETIFRAARKLSALYKISNLQVVVERKIIAGKTEEEKK